MGFGKEVFGGLNWVYSRRSQYGFLEERVWNLDLRL